LKLGLAPAQPVQIVRLTEPPARSGDGRNDLAERSAPGEIP
jgi:hypothetical protein